MEKNDHFYQYACDADGSFIFKGPAIIGPDCFCGFKSYSQKHMEAAQKIFLIHFAMDNKFIICFAIDLRFMEWRSFEMVANIENKITIPLTSSLFRRA